MAARRFSSELRSHSARSKPGRSDAPPRAQPAGSWQPGTGAGHLRRPLHRSGGLALEHAAEHEACQHGDDDEPGDDRERRIVPPARPHRRDYANRAHVSPVVSKSPEGSGGAGGRGPSAPASAAAARSAGSGPGSARSCGVATASARGRGGHHRGRRSGAAERAWAGRGFLPASGFGFGFGLIGLRSAGTRVAAASARSACRPGLVHGDRRSPPRASAPATRPRTPGPRSASANASAIRTSAVRRVTRSGISPACVLPGIRQRSMRSGALPRRVRTRVYLPIFFGWVTRISIVALRAIGALQRADADELRRDRLALVRAAASLAVEPDPRAAAAP